MRLVDELRRYCAAGERWPDSLLHAVVEEAASSQPRMAAAVADALFRDLIEPLCDSFEPRNCDTYAELLAGIAGLLCPGASAAVLLDRYRRIRRPRRAPAAGIEQVFVLSRVTLGADVAVTSVMLDAAKRAFPSAPIGFAGSVKAWELFARDPRLRHVPVNYGRRAALVERLAIRDELEPILSVPRSLVIDPDSRLTQLGLLPVCPEENYFFFESRSYGGSGSRTLPELAAKWCEETFGIGDARPYLAPEVERSCPERPFVAISLGVGENQAKRLADPFEENLVRSVLEAGAFLVIDKGAPGEEFDRVERILGRVAAHAERIYAWQGAFAPFASMIARASMYIGYDSAGQHVAAATGTPLAVIFNGFAGERTVERWRPSGPGAATIVRGDRLAADQVLAEVMGAARRAGAFASR